MSLITLKTFDNPVDAHLVKTKLEAEGIPSALFDENIINLNPLLNNAVGGIKLKIHPENQDVALEIMKKLESLLYTNDKDEIIFCPHCGSTNIRTGHKTLKGFKGFLATVIAGLTFTVPFHDTVYDCKDCQKSFSPKN